MVSTTIHIKNMISKSCIKIIQLELENAGVKVESINLGQAHIIHDPDKISFNEIDKILNDNGFGIILDREQQIVEEIKKVVIELIHHLNNVDSIVRKSEYLVERMNMGYQTLSKLFSKHEKTTLEKYIIYNKIERVKELIISNEYTLSEISFMMDYNSVQYLSNQFKKITGVSVTDYKKQDDNMKIPIDELIEYYANDNKV